MASLDAWPGHLLLRPLWTAPRRLESDVESGKGLHKGDLRTRVRVPRAAPALQGFVPVPLLLAFLLLQSLLLLPLSVCDLEEKTTVGRRLAQLPPAAC